MADEDSQQEAHLFTLRVPEGASRVTCPVCAVEFLASGPTGYWNETPICDECMFKMSRPLGATLALVAVSRSFARQEYEENGRFLKAAAEVCVFAELYEEWLAPFGPPRLALALTPLGMRAKAEAYCKENLS